MRKLIFRTLKQKDCDDTVDSESSDDEDSWELNKGNTTVKERKDPKCVAPEKADAETMVPIQLFVNIAYYH